jgi:hypothetical protein
MQSRSVNQYRSLIFVVALIGLLVYVGLAFLPYPAPISPGLDPSWAYAISRAVKDDLIFGKDIIFTFGPLGYLITGMALDPELLSQSAVFRLITHILLFISVSIKVVTLRAHWQRLVIVTSVIFAYLSALFGTDYQLLFTFIIFLSFENLFTRSPLIWTLTSGIFSGFCLLTKFTLGVSTFGSLLLFIIGDYLASNLGRIYLKKHALALLNIPLAAFSTSFIFLASAYYWVNFRKVFICLTISALASFLTWMTQKYIYNRHSNSTLKNNQDKSYLLDAEQGFQGWQFAFYISYSTLIIFVILNSSPSLAAFLKNSFEISSGYSSAMSVVDSRSFLLGLGVSSLLLILILLMHLALQGNLWFSLPLLLNLFLTFKHGFVFQDAHILIYAYSASFIIALIISKLQKPTFQRAATLLHIYSLVIIIIFFNNSLSNHAPFEKFIHSQLNPARIAQSYSIFNLHSVKSGVINASQNNLASLRLPDSINHLLKDKTIDIVPTEVSLVAANQLRWVPRPIFQSYSAYTKKLDDINFKSLSSTPRDYILYSFNSIGERHPFFDEPRTFFQLYCNYQLPLNLSTFVSTQAIPELMLLERRKQSKCSPERVDQDASILWNTQLRISSSDTNIVRASVEIQYSMFGKLFKTLFRAAPVMMEVNYKDGSKQSYRIIPENSSNGVVVSHLPRNHQEALSFWQGQLSANVETFSLQAVNPFLYKPVIHIRLISTDLRK